MRGPFLFSNPSNKRKRKSRPISSKLTWTALFALKPLTLHAEQIITELSPKRRLLNFKSGNGKESLIGGLDKCRHTRENGYPVCLNSPEIPGFPRARE
jgi:hypothetical protein